MIQYCRKKKSNYQFVTLALFYATLHCTLQVCSLSQKLKRELRPFTQAVCNFPSVNCMQSTDNKHSISQCEKRASTSLFCSRRKRKDATLVASQDRGHNIRAAQVSNVSPASNCTQSPVLSGHNCTVPFSFNTLENALCSAPSIYII